MSLTYSAKVYDIKEKKYIKIRGKSMNVRQVLNSYKKLFEYYRIPAIVFFKQNYEVKDSTFYSFLFSAFVRTVQVPKLYKAMNDKENPTTVVRDLIAENIIDWNKEIKKYLAS